MSARVARLFVLSVVAVATCAALGADPQPAGPDWWRFLGRLHPVLVHFPIGLLIAAVFLELIHALFGRERGRPGGAGLWCVVLGALGAGAAAWAGWTNADVETHGRAVASLIETHRWLGIATCAVAGLVALLGLGALRAPGKLTGVYRVGVVLGAIMVGVAGHWGGTIVFGDGYLTAGLFPPKPADQTAPIVEPAPALTPDGRVRTVDFATQIAPIFEARCIECHGPRRAKGRLRLDDRRYVLDEPDEDERVILPGDADASELVYRITLPHGDPDIMPPEDGPLSDDQIELIRTWIDEGAAWGAIAIAPPTAEEPTSEPPAPVGEPEAPAVEPSDAAAEAPADPASIEAALEALREHGAVATRIAQDADWVEVRLDLLDRDVTDADLAMLEPLAPVLASLDLTGTDVTDAGLEHVARLAHLRSLRLGRTTITDAGLVHLTSLTELEYLNLIATPVTDAGLSMLTDLPALRRLYVWGTETTPDGIELFRLLRPDAQIDDGDTLPDVPDGG